MQNASNKKRSLTAFSSQKKSKVQSKAASGYKEKPQLVNTCSPFEDSPESKLQGNIKEELNMAQQQPKVTDFGTIVKIDKKTEEKLMQSFIERSAGKKPIHVRS